MKKHSKIILIVIIIVIIVGIAAFFITRNFDAQKEDKFVTEANGNNGVIKTQKVDGLKISNVMLVVKEEGSTFTADVTNTTDKEINGNLDIIFKTSTDKEVTSIDRKSVV